MLHDPGHIAPLPEEQEIHLAQKDKDVLRSLGEKIALISSDPINAKRAKLWTALNDKKAVRPMVWINEVPWHEMNVNDELTIRCENTWAQELERDLRRTIYQWEHFPGDMVVSPYIECPKIVHSTDFGIVEQVDVLKTDEENEIVSRHFIKQISDFEDLEKIKLPKLTYLDKATRYAYDAMTDVFGSILPVRVTGQKHIWYTPWDYLIRWWGVQDAMMDLVMQPELVHAAYEKMVQAWMVELNQFEEQNLLELDCGNVRIGSGGYGYVSDLPGQDFVPEKVTAKNMWGCANAQIFSSVSPEMHWEFAVEHDMKWLNRFGLTYYGCCEPLDNKAEVLARIPNLRKVSVSPWCNTEKAVQNLGERYVLSRKPNPAVFVSGQLDATEVRRQLTDFMDCTEGKCSVEIIMKDISTVKYHPEQLWEWEKIAMDVSEQYAR